MLRRSVFTVGIGWVVLTASAFAADPPTVGPTTESKVQALVEKLGAADYREREKAQRDLVALGPTARAALKQAAAATDNPEIERRLDVMIARIEREELIQPKRVTFQGNKPIAELLKEIGSQTGYKIEGGPNDDKQKLKVDWRGKTFWEALDEVSTAAGLNVQVYDNGTDGSQVNVYSNDTFDPHVAYAGPFRVAATNIGSNRNLQLSGVPRKGVPFVPQHSLNLNLMLLSEPKNTMLSTGLVVVTKAEDDTGASLILTDDTNSRFSYYQPGGYRNNSQYLYVNLGKPSREATIIKELKGKVTVSLLASTRPELTIEKLLTVKKKSFVSRTTELLIESVGEPTDAGFSINLSAKYLQPTNEDYNWSNAIFQRLEAYDEAGVKFGPASVTSQTQSPGAVTLSLSFAPPASAKKVGKPAKLVLVEYVTVPREIEFTFKNVPLP